MVGGNEGEVISFLLLAMLLAILQIHPSPVEL